MSQELRDKLKNWRERSPYHGSHDRYAALKAATESKPKLKCWSPPALIKEEKEKQDEYIKFHSLPF